MRELLLLRHAKSSWDDASLADFDRPLSQRGLKAAPRMGAAMARRGWAPDLALVSPALRTRRTWERVAPALPAPAAVLFPAALYEADAATILDLVRAEGGAARRVLVVGHNPGLEGLARRLASPASEPGALAGLAQKFPTGALARFEIAGEWADLAGGAARLTHFLRPRDLVRTRS